VTKVLGEISEGVTGVLKRVGEMEGKFGKQTEGLQAKFVEAEKATADLATKVTTMEGEVKTMAEYLRERKLAAGQSTSVPGLDEDIKRKKFSLGRVMGAMGMIALEPSEAKSIWEKHAPYEFEVGQEARKKAVDTGTGGAGGGYLIPQEYLTAQFFDLLRANLTVIQAGATMVTGLTGTPARVPGQTGTATPYWVAQNAAITKSNATFGEVTMTPKLMGMRAQLSNLSLLMTNPDVETLVRNDFAAVAALEIDRTALRGAGTSEPLGIANTPSIPTLTLGANGGPFTWDTAVDFEGALEDENALKGRLGFIMSAKVKRKLKKIRIPQYSGDTGGMYVMPPVITDQMVRDMIGYPFFTTTQIPTDLTKNSGTSLSEVYYGNWADLLIGLWGSVEILATNIGGDAWAQGSVEVRLMQSLDVCVRRLKSFCFCNEVETV
jgi:HK97 family phage major capsid protein